MTMATKAMGRSACSRASPALAKDDDLEDLELLFLPNDEPEAFIEFDRLWEVRSMYEV